MNIKTDFTEIEKNIIEAISSLYSIQTLIYKDGVFKGLIPKGVRLSLNGEYFMQLLNTSNAIYLESKSGGMNVLTIIAQ